jgi:cytochrome c oxidase cbb3-type subunit 3
MADAERRTDALQGEIIHVYDGIEEADNSMPRWWLAVLFGTIGFAAAYWFGYEVYGLKPTPAAEFAARKVEIERAQLAAAANTPDMSEDALAALAKNPQAVAQGASVFKQNCAACHGDKGEGKIGPNLTDGFWLHGGATLAVHKTIRDGVPAKGMPPWGPVLGPDGVQRVAAFVLSIRNTRVPGREPQGDPESAGGG